MSENYKILKRPPYRVQHHPMNLSTVIHLLQNGDLDLNAYYQREYVWNDDDRRYLMDSIVNHKPIGSCCIVIRDPNADGAYMEVVDGKQRLTTIDMFINDKFSYNGYYWSDLSRMEQRLFKEVKIGWGELSMKVESDSIREDIILQHFYDVNFVGRPQSEEHKFHIEKLLKECYGRE